MHLELAMVHAASPMSQKIGQKKYRASPWEAAAHQVTFLNLA